MNNRLFRHLDRVAKLAAIRSFRRLVTLSVVSALFAGVFTTSASAQGRAPQGQAPQQGGVAPGVWSAAPAGQAQASPGACGSQPMCYDAPDYAVAVVDFRMSNDRGSKVMDATLRFVNKTNQPLILGYVDGSAVALDDQGNRYGTYANQGLAGIGVVSGPNADPKFVLQSGGSGDARFRLFWHPGAQDPVGSSFELDMNIREVNTLVGGAHTLGGEVPLRFQGLANGMTGAGLANSGAGSAGAAGVAGMAGGAGTAGVAGASTGFANGGMATAAALGPCNPNSQGIGSSNAANANSTTANAANNVTQTVANFKSMFGKKKTAQPAAAGGNGNPCLPGGSGAAAQTTTAAPSAQNYAAAPGTAPASQAQPAAVVQTTVATPGANPPRQQVAPPAQKAALTPPANVKSTAPANNQKKPAPTTNNQKKTTTQPSAQ